MWHLSKNACQKVCQYIDTCGFMPAKKVLITLTEDLQKELDQQVKHGRFVSRSEVIREAVRKFLSDGK